MPSSGSGQRPDTYMLVTDIDRLMQSLGSKSRKVPDKYQEQFRTYMKTAVDWGLPHPWEEKVVKESGKVYYWNHEEGVPSWTHPLQEDFRAISDVWHRILKVCKKFETSGLDVHEARAESVEMSIEIIRNEVEDFDVAISEELKKWRSAPAKARPDDPSGRVFYFRYVETKNKKGKGKQQVIRQWQDPRKTFNDRREARASLLQRILDKDFFPFDETNVTPYIQPVKVELAKTLPIPDPTPTPESTVGSIQPAPDFELKSNDPSRYMNADAYLKFLGVEEGERGMRDIIAPLLTAQLPLPWRVVCDEQRRVLFVHDGLQETFTRHPLEHKFLRIVKLVRRCALFLDKPKTFSFFFQEESLQLILPDPHFGIWYGPFATPQGPVYADVDGRRRVDNPGTAAVRQARVAVQLLKKLWHILTPTSPFPIVKNHIDLLVSELPTKIVVPVEADACLTTFLKNSGFLVTPEPSFTSSRARSPGKGREHLAMSHEDINIKDPDPAQALVEEVITRSSIQELKHSLSHHSLASQHSQILHVEQTDVNEPAQVGVIDEEESLQQEVNVSKEASEVVESKPAVKEKTPLPKIEFPDDLFGPADLDVEKYEQMLQEKVELSDNKKLFDASLHVKDVIVKPYLEDLYTRMVQKVVIMKNRQELVQKTQAAERVKDLPAHPSVPPLPLAQQDDDKEDRESVSSLSSLKEKFKKHFVERVVTPFMKKKEKHDARPRSPSSNARKCKQEKSYEDGEAMSPGKRNSAPMKRKLAKVIEHKPEEIPMTGCLARPNSPGQIKRQVPGFGYTTFNDYLKKKKVSKVDDLFKVMAEYEKYAVVTQKAKKNDLLPPYLKASTPAGSPRVGTKGKTPRGRSQHVSTSKKRILSGDGDLFPHSRSLPSWESEHKPLVVFEPSYSARGVKPWTPPVSLLKPIGSRLKTILQFKKFLMTNVSQRSPAHQSWQMYDRLDVNTCTKKEFGAIAKSKWKFTDEQVLSIWNAFDPYNTNKTSGDTYFKLLDEVYDEASQVPFSKKKKDLLEARLVEKQKEDMCESVYSSMLGDLMLKLEDEIVKKSLEEVVQEALVHGIKKPPPLPDTDYLVDLTRKRDRENLLQQAKESRDKANAKMRSRSPSPKKKVTTAEDRERKMLELEENARAAMNNEGSVSAHPSARTHSPGPLSPPSPPAFPSTEPYYPSDDEPPYSCMLSAREQLEAERGWRQIKKAVPERKVNELRPIKDTTMFNTYAPNFKALHTKKKTNVPCSVPSAVVKKSTASSSSKGKSRMNYPVRAKKTVAPPSYKPKSVCKTTKRPVVDDTGLSLDLGGGGTPLDDDLQWMKSHFDVAGDISLWQKPQEKLKPISSVIPKETLRKKKRVDSPSLPALDDDDAWSFMAQMKMPASGSSCGIKPKVKTKSSNKKAVPYVPAGSQYIDSDGQQILDRFDELRTLATKASKRDGMVWKGLQKSLQQTELAFERALGKAFLDGPLSGRRDQDKLPVIPGATSSTQANIHSLN